MGKLLGEAGFSYSWFAGNEDGLNSASGRVPECAVQDIEFRVAAEKTLLVVQALVIVLEHPFLLERLSPFHTAQEVGMTLECSFTYVSHSLLFINCKS